MITPGQSGSDAHRQDASAIIEARHALGREVFGPILAEFAIRLWTFLSGFPEPQQAKLLFCARGGLRLRLVYERVLANTGLESPIAFDDLMVSRVVAARGAMLVGSPAARDEILREFAGDTCLKVAEALAGERLAGARIADVPVDERGLARLFRHDDGDLTDVGLLMQQQDKLFRQHLAEKTAGRSHLILCDTGLYGSTIRMLKHAVPEMAWNCAQFARSNYKRFDTAHFATTIGLSVEHDRYTPFDTRSGALRYWHVVESLLEPPLPSVRKFFVRGGQVVSNLEVDGWQALITPSGAEDALFAGVMSSIESLSARGAPSAIFADASKAWKRLHRLVVWPTPHEAQLLMVGERSRDFGRTDMVSALANPTERAGRLAAVRRSLWREGATALAFPATRIVIQAALQGFHALRALQR
jgi:hypothetical protein